MVRLGYILKAELPEFSGGLETGIRQDSKGFGLND